MYVNTNTSSSTNTRASACRLTCDFFEGDDNNKQHVYHNTVRRTETGSVLALYYFPYEEDETKYFYYERIGKIDLDYKECTFFKYAFKLKTLMQEHVDEVYKTCEYIEKTLKIPLAEAVLTNKFAILRQVARTVKKINTIQDPIETLRQKIMRFISCLEMRNRNDYFLKLNADFESDKDDTFLVSPMGEMGDGSSVIIIDNTLPLEASLARLLALDPTSKIPYPTVSHVIDTWFEVHELRSECAHYLEDYIYYFEGLPVVATSGGERASLDWDLFEHRELLSKEDLKTKIIDQAFIDDAIRNEYIPEGRRKRLEKFVGQTFRNALVIESGLCGNMKRVRKLLDEEITALDAVDKFLFYSIYVLCNLNQTKEKINKFVNKDFSGWNSVQEKYEYFAENEGLSPELIELKNKCSPFLGDSFQQPAWKKLKRIYKHLKGKEQEISLDLSDQALRELLKVIKMFHLAIAVHNCGVPACEKNVFEKGSYELRVAIQEKDRNLQSYEVHTKKISLDDLKEKAIEEYLKSSEEYKKSISLDDFIEKKMEEYRSDSHHWEPERVSLHSRLFQKTYIEARVLSDLIAQREVEAPLGDSSSRGTLCSGKSTGTPDVMGVLNPDFIKWRLREETNLTNYQIHEEGSMIFKCCFNEVKKNIKYHILDLCLKKPGDVNKYLTEPAQKNNCSVFISDHDVPLLTSLNRILLREPRGKDPITTIKNLTGVFKEIRQNREEILRAIKKNDLFEQYDLYYLGELIGQKNNGEFEIFDYDKYDKCLFVPSNEEIEDELNRIIDEQYIYEALERGDFRPDQAALFFEKWGGSSVHAAIEAHSRS